MDQRFVELLLAKHVKTSRVVILPHLASKSASVGERMFAGRTTAEAVRAAMDWIEAGMP